MAKASHTPAPWMLDGNVIYALDETNTTNRFSAQVCGGYVRRDTRGRGNDVRTPYLEIAANFRLMRAGPEMLDALEVLCGFAKALGASETDRPMVRARAAIAKATGGAE